MLCSDARSAAAAALLLLLLLLQTAPALLRCTPRHCRQRARAAGAPQAQPATTVSAAAKWRAHAFGFTMGASAAACLQAGARRALVRPITSFLEDPSELRPARVEPVSSAAARG
jgi:hypothetical protein